MSIGERLREERERIGLTQPALGAVGGVQKQAQLKYESGTRCPSADYLIQIAKIGVDVNYVLFGTRANNALTDEEQQLLVAFRAAPPMMRQFMLSGMTSTQQTVTKNIKIKGSGNKQRITGVVDSMEIKGDNNVQIAGISKKTK